MRIYQTVLLTAALVPCSCSDAYDDVDGIPAHTISSIEAEIDDARTRTTIESDGTGLRTLWSDGDAILVTDLVSSSKFTLRHGAGTTQGTFGGSIATSEQTLYGIYPSSSAVMTDSSVQVRIPSVQSHTSNADISVSGKNLMVGVTGNAREFRFHPVASIVRFSIILGSDETISEVTMRCQDEHISGSGTIEPASAELGTLSSGSATLSYAEPESGNNAEGWMLIAPVDFTVGNGKVYYDVTTDRGTYTFCRRPTKRFLGGTIYTIPLHVASFTKVASASSLDNDRYTFTSNASQLTVRQVRATDSTISIAWSKSGFPDNYGLDIADRYTVHILDAEGNTVVAWSPNQNAEQCVGSAEIYKYSSADATYPPRWCFSGLEPDTEYTIYVRDVTTGVTSNMLHTATIPVDCGAVVSAARNPGDVILFQNFAREIWCGDIMSLAAGYLHAAYETITDITAGKAGGDCTSTTQTTFQYCNRSKESDVFKACLASLQSRGLAGWGYWRNPADDATSSTSIGVYIHPGYLKIGLKNVRAGLVTPKLTPLLGRATLRVSFKAATYGAASASDDTDIAVVALDGCTESGYRVSGEEIARSCISLRKTLEWNQYSVEIKGVTPTSRLAFIGNAASVAGVSNRFCIDDIKVELSEYEQAVDTTLPTVTQVDGDTTSATVEWTSDESGAFRIALYSDMACTTGKYSFSTTTSGDTSYIEWPRRFTLSYLEPDSRYYLTVTSPAGKVSKPVAVTTTATPERDRNTLQSQRFERLPWGGDYIHMANALNLYGVSVYTLSPDNLDSTLEYCRSTSNPTVDGANIASFSTTLRALCGLEGWTSYNVFSRPGYVKVGSTMLGGWIQTPIVDGLASDNAEVEVRFKACPYVTDSRTAQNPEVVVSLLDDGGLEISAQSVTIGSFRNEPGWGSFSVTLHDVCNGQYIRIASAGKQNSMFCLDDIEVLSDKAIDEALVHGYVRYSDGKPAANVVVSDGFQSTATDANGYYRMTCTKDVWYIFYSLPADCEVDYDTYGQPCFFRKYTYGTHRYDFTLTRMSGGKEKSFTLFCLADPQCRSTSNISRFSSETVPALKSSIASRSNRCYGVTLGDVVHSSDGRNTNPLMPSMRSACSSSTTGFPIFQTMGNHDYTYFYGTDNPNFSDETSSTPNLRAQRAFETAFGPINYSWNRSDTHIVCMRDIVYTSLTSASSGCYYGGFTKEQYDWLRSDLQYVTKDKMVIVCVHIPLNNVTRNSYVSSLIDLIKGYTNPQIMSGHTHYMKNTRSVNGTTVVEHTHAAVCGAWWSSNLNGDGCPNGFGVYDITGNAIRDHCYMGTNTGMNDRSYQIRLYRGNQLSGGSYEYFQTQYGYAVLLANVFNTDSKWTVKVYENGVYSGTMSLIANKHYTDSSLPYVSTVSPTMVPSNSSQDWWTIGYHVGTLGIGHKSGTRGNYMTTCTHMYRYTLKDAGATVRVVATDDVGNTYTQTEVMPATSTTDYYPAYIKSGNH